MEKLNVTLKLDKPIEITKYTFTFPDNMSKDQINDIVKVFDEELKKL